MAEFIYKGFLISVRRAKSGGGWHATATVQRTAEDREVVFNADAPGIADLVNKIEESIHQHRSRLGKASPSGPGRSSGSSPLARGTG